MIPASNISGLDSPDFLIEETSFDRASIATNGCKFMIGNGRMGVRGTLEEFSKEQLAACTLAGVYDQLPGKWREPVNAPNPFYVRAFHEGVLLSAESLQPVSHRQWIDMRTARHGRETVFRLDGGLEVSIKAVRFLSAAETHAGVMRYSIEASRDCELVIEAGIDGDVWDLNGPHLGDFAASEQDGVLVLGARTHEQGRALAVGVAYEETLPAGNTRPAEIAARATSITRRVTVRARAGAAYSFSGYISFFCDTENAAARVVECCRGSLATGCDAMFAAHCDVWDGRWRRSDVEIDGDPGAQLALRHGIYQLLIVAPSHTDRVSIPARGLSGQVYKGGVFWDTEIFMLPFFTHTQPETARRLLSYRSHTLDGARRKAADLGFRGAFYAWESQETGDDACTYFNVTDVFTGRPLRTYFRDKQVHVSADVAVAIWNYYRQTGDTEFIVEGGAEVILECARFFLSRACIDPDTGRHEIRDVVGPDEYHERVDNNAFTNAMVAATLRIAIDTLELMRNHDARALATLVARLDYANDARRLGEMAARLYRPSPSPDSGVIEQFDGYHRMEDASLVEVTKRVIQPSEYWGATHGVAANTKIIKQADVVLMLHLFRDEFSEDVKRANWEYYEPRTEHGSSLSPCVYALVAADIGKTDWAYRYFLKTATIDLTGDSKQYVGPLYIGGTHPAANGGAWMAAVLGFGGLRVCDGFVRLDPVLPEGWESLAFSFCARGDWFRARITRGGISVTADAANRAGVEFRFAGGAGAVCAPGATLSTDVLS
ncbi:glycoside hydrolase family 65 protein [Ereboglobus luteus]|uniref:Family 65 glycosyl hydrolase n=1 Tax=Ereboglobus luteus TaxID=1796921 RepID=A0A2U8E548_9BACT|nr:glycosyl hydrolase family 65 protein [Ereboglobus luteus]AWI09956.1 family 65 glycosyl hydrolase [Ereboglobus luteus]